LVNAPQIVEHGERLLTDDKHVILDLSEATFIDVAVIHALSHVKAEAKKNGRVVVLQLGTAPIVERVIEITQIDRQLHRVSTRTEALDKIRQLQPPT
jgi:anti-anti-sigma regulatory factor